MNCWIRIHTAEVAGSIPASPTLPSHDHRFCELAGGPNGLWGQEVEVGGEFHAARGVPGEVHSLEHFIEWDAPSPRRQVQVPQPEDGVLGDRRLARYVGSH